jgi:hypothetical protein
MRKMKSQAFLTEDTDKKVINRRDSGNNGE